MTATSTEAPVAPTGAASNGSSSSPVDTRLLRMAGRLVAPTAAATSWLYYVGWVKTNRQAAYFGIDPSLLAYSTTDYVLRSVTSLLGPVAAVLIGLILLSSARRQLDRALATHAGLRARAPALGRRARLAGVGLVCAGGFHLFRIGTDGYAAPTAAVCLLGGALALVTERYLSSVTPSGRRARSTAGPRGRTDAIEALAIGLVVVAALFAGGFFYAVQVGVLSARSLADRLPAQAEVQLLSTTDLQLGGSARCLPIRGGDDTFRCRYTGLRLLVEAHGRLFLVPETWKDPANGYVYVIPVTDQIRLDVRSR